MRLGLKISSTSIGWWLYATEDGKISQVIDGGVRTFSDGRNPKDRSSLGAARRYARQRRRTRDRYLRRRNGLMKSLIQAGLFPENEPERKSLEMLDPYLLRSQALDHRLSLEHFGRAIFHLNQRRGFLSNSQAEGRDTETGKIKDASVRLDGQMSLLGARTYGEFLYLRRGAPLSIEAEVPLRIREQISHNRGAGQIDFFPERRHLLAEFELMWAKQTVFHPSHLTCELRRELKNIIFFQRTLKRPAKSVCRLTSEPRLEWAHPASQRLKLYQTVNNLRIPVPNGGTVPLTLAQRDTLILMLDKKSVEEQSEKFSLVDAGKFISSEPRQTLRFDRSSRHSISCDVVQMKMAHSTHFGPAWNTLNFDQKWHIVKRLQNSETDEDRDSFVAWLTQTHNLDQVSVRNLTAAKLPRGSSSFGLSATKKILEVLASEVISLDEAIETLEFSTGDISDNSNLNKLPYYGQILTGNVVPGTNNPHDDDIARFGRLPNPTLHIAFNQLSRLVNKILGVYGRPEEIFVELDQDIRWTESRKAISGSAKKKAVGEIASFSGRLDELGVANTGENRLRLRLWDELTISQTQAVCPYSGDPIKLHMVLMAPA